MKLIRYSHTGWQPHFQSRMKEYYDYIVECNKSELETKKKWKEQGFTEFAAEQTFVYLEKEAINLNIKFCWTGIHVFFNTATPEDIDFFLNHLPEYPPRHEKEWPDNTPAYSLSGSFTDLISTIGKLREKGEIGAYLPIKDNETPF